MEMAVNVLNNGISDSNGSEGLAKRSVRILPEFRLNLRNKLLLNIL